MRDEKIETCMELRSKNAGQHPYRPKEAQANRDRKLGTSETLLRMQRTNG